MPGMDPRKMAQAMKAMGIKQKEINADEVVIKAEGREIVVSNPKVIEIDMQGTKTFQVMGDISERGIGPSEEDVKMVMEQAGADEEKARAALEKSSGDIAEAIMALKG
ncbi:MAG: nascent polypeptide-associated complex protein [Candidatus Diapherotrites archaeon]|nr:nascent polypeptide-associated complex protein [Candidatus Diapherotrites archaeon]